MGCYKLHNYTTLQIAHTSNTARSREGKSDAGLYKYKFNGKEYQDELGLGWYDYQARNYDPAIGRWMNIDPLAEMSRKYSLYTYCLDNPVIFVDPDGMLAEPSIDIGYGRTTTPSTSASAVGYGVIATPPDWFVNNKTGAVVYVKGESKLTQEQADAVGAGDAKNYDRLGPDGMFGKEVQYGTGDILKMDAYNVENPEGFMKNQGYSKAEKVKIQEYEFTGGAGFGQGENIKDNYNTMKEIGDSKVTYTKNDKLNSTKVLSEEKGKSWCSNSTRITYDLIKPFGQDNAVTAKLPSNRASSTQSKVEGAIQFLRMVVEFIEGSK
jgi:RHS repeat-associated protein